jgi:hypothetical protein
MNTSRYRKLFTILLTSLLTLTIFTSAFATSPEFITRQIDETSEFGTCDGFSVIEHLEGTIKASFQYDQDGNFRMRIARFALSHTFTNSVTGASLFTPDVGIDQEFTTHFAVIGLVGRIVVPGQGLVFVNLGRLVYDNTGEVIFEAGPHDNFDDLLPVLCSALD